MTHQKTSTSLTILLANTTFAALAIAGGTVSTVAYSSDLPQIVVKYGDLNSSPQGAAALYGRIAAAAHYVCGGLDYGDPDLASQFRWTACVHKAIREAVADVGQPTLIAVYNARNREKLVLLALARRDN